MSCRLDLPPQMLNLAPSVPHPLSKKKDIKQGRNPSWIPASVPMGQMAPQDTSMQYYHPYQDEDAATMMSLKS